MFGSCFVKFGTGIVLNFLFFVLPFSLCAQQNSLDYYISKALSNSPLLKDYRNQIQSGVIDSSMIRASYKVQAAGVSNDYYAPVIKGWGQDNVITNGANINTFVGVNKTFVSSKNLGKQFEAIRLNELGIKNTSDMSEQDIIRTVTSQYIATYGDWQQLNFTSEVYSLLVKEDTILKKLTQNNIYKQTDYLTFLVTMQQQRLAMKQTAIQYRTSYATLLFLTGLTDTAMNNLLEPVLSVKALPSPQNSVFFRQYEIDSLKNINSHEMIDFSYKPKASVFTEGGYNSSLTSNSFKNFGVNLGLAITLPIYDGNQRKMKHNKINLAESTRQSYRSFFNEQYHQQIEELFRQLKSTDALISEIDSQIKYSEGLINAHLKLLPTGEVRITDLVIAINNYMNAQNLLTQNRTSRWQIINQINYWSR